MSFTPDKVDVKGAEEIMGQKVFVIRFLQCRNEGWRQSSLVWWFRSPSWNAITMGQDRLASKCPANFVLNTERLSFSMACMWNFVSGIVSHCLQIPLISELFWHPTAFVCGTWSVNTTKYLSCELYISMHALYVSWKLYHSLPSENDRSFVDFSNLVHCIALDKTTIVTMPSIIGFKPFDAMLCATLISPTNDCLL